MRTTMKAVVGLWVLTTLSCAGARVTRSPHHDEGPVLTVSATWTGDAPSTVTLTPDAAGRGGGVWATNDGTVTFNWVSDTQLRVEVRDPRDVALGVRTTTLGRSALVFGEKTLTLDARRGVLANGEVQLAAEQP